MVTQYGTYNSYSSISNTYLNAFYSHLGPLDEYIIMQTGENEYTMLVHRIPSKEVESYKIFRQYYSGGSGYNQYYYTMTGPTDDTWEYSVSNELYVYSNVGLGTMAVLPVHEIMVCFAVSGAVCLLFLALVFKGAIIKCLRPSKRRAF